VIAALVLMLSGAAGFSPPATDDGPTGGLKPAAPLVAWRAYGDAAFAEAKRTDRPVFVSVGYSTCHWCHMMDKESFSDPAIAALLNDHFVPIKIDREERPDLDAVYIAVTRTLTGDAGWPNHVILTPDGKPFYAMSYVPKDKFRALLPRIAAQWSEQRERVVANAEMIVRSLQTPPAAGDALGVDVLGKGYAQLTQRFDAKHGGFGPAPKFPAPHHLMFLLRYWQRTRDAKALEMVETTLVALRASPLWDSRNSGFHRYATNADWSAPHYEKMLYDQALLALAYLEAYQATHKPEYAATARAIFTYVLRDLRAPDGTFYAAQDADEEYYAGRKTAKPARDEKRIADWNGLMIAALAFGANVLDEPSYAAAAAKAADAIAPRRFLDDHAFLVWGLLNLYEATFDVRHLQRAIAVNGEAVRLFRDPKSGRFYITAHDAAALLVRPRETGDGSIPSGSSVQLMNLVRLAKITARAEYQTYADALFRAASDEVTLAPSVSTHLLSALDFALGPSQEIVLSGRDVTAMRRAVFSRFAPNQVVVHRPPGDAPAIVKIAPYTAPQRAINGKATAYVCTDHLCRLPVTDPAQLATR
jgi:uncharacterized protein YyaL (SSP411 family)